MRYYRYLYLSEGLKKKKDRIIAKLEKKKFQMDIYLITLSCNGNSQLEIWNSVLFLQPSFPQTDHFVVGITKGYEEALELVEQITKEVYNETKGADIRSYILNKEQEMYWENRRNTEILSVKCFTQIDTTMLIEISAHLTFDLSANMDKTKKT